MKNNKVLFFLLSVCVMVVGLPVGYTQDNAGAMASDTYAHEPPPQGTIIPCEKCVVLYPERFEDNPSTCPVCHGAKEHFQPARLMDQAMAQMRLHEIDLAIQEKLHDTLIDSLDEPVGSTQLKDVRTLYRHKLIHLLVYDFPEVETAKEKIRQLDEMLEEQ